MKETNMRRLSILVPLLTMIPASPVLAVDGVLEINQACATSAAGCLSGDASGFPVTVSQRGAYRLTTNLTVPNANTTAIQIAIDGVSVDLNGFAIVGPATCTGVPVTSCSISGTGVGILGPDHVTVRNGVIRGMGAEAIKLDWNARVENVEVVFDQLGTGFGAIDVGNQSTVVDSSATSNRGYGIFCAEACILRGNTATGNGQSGLALGPSGIASGNTATSNGEYGITALIGSSVGANVASSNGADGIFAGTGSNVTGNTVRQNVGAGLGLQGQTTYRENTITANGFTVNGGVNQGNNYCNGPNLLSASCP
jgi:parallel beta-helix repeat protein